MKVIESYLNVIRLLATKMGKLGSMNAAIKLLSGWFLDKNLTKSCKTLLNDYKNTEWTGQKILIILLRIIEQSQDKRNLLILNLKYSNLSYRSGIILRWTIIFAIIALVASLLGFSGVAGLSESFAYVFLVVAVILFVLGFLFRGK